MKEIPKILEILEQANTVRELIIKDAKRQEIDTAEYDLTKLIKSEPKLKNNFAFADISDFFVMYNLGRKISLTVVSKKTFKKNFKDYLFSKPHELTYYFPVDYPYGIIKNRKIGNGKILKYSKLPKSIRKKLEDNRDFVIMKHSQGLSDTQYKKRLKNEFFMEIKINSIGNFISRTLALRSFQQNRNIFNFFTQNYFSDEEAPSYTGYIIADNKGRWMGEQYQASSKIHQRSFYTNHIPKLNIILKKSSLNELERRIISAIDIVGNSNDEPNIEIRFLFCLIAIENLLAGDDKDYLRWRLSERLAFLLYDDKGWIHYYKELPKGFKMTKKFISENKLDSRKKLFRTMKELYDKRSALAHTKKKQIRITEEDYNLARYLLLQLTIKLFKILEKGITHIQNQKIDDEKSLENLIIEMKFK